MFIEIDVADKRKDWEAMREWCFRILAVEPANVDAMEILLSEVDALVEDGNWPEVFRLSKRILDHDPTNSDATAFLAMAEVSKRPKGESTYRIDSAARRRGVSENIERGMLYRPIPRLRDTYRSAKTRSVIARFTLVALIVTLMVSIALTLEDISLLDRLQHGAFVPDRELQDHDNRNVAVFVLYFWLLIATIITFLVWQLRVASNLSILGALRMRFTPGWGVVWWFVPFMNLFRPHQVLSELWKANDPEIPAEEYSPDLNQDTSPLMGWWWASWLIGNYVGWAISRATPTSLESLLVNPNMKFFAQLSIASDVVLIISAGLAIWLIGDISARQEAKYENMSTTTPD